MARIVFIYFLAICLTSFSDFEKSPYVIILGTAQDGGAPHAGKICWIGFVNDAPDLRIILEALLAPPKRFKHKQTLRKIG